MDDVVRPENIQTIIALLLTLAGGFVTTLMAVAGLFVQSRRLKLRLGEQEADAIKREADSKDAAEQIQLNAQTFVQETATRLQEQIFQGNNRYDKLRDEYTNVVAADAKKETRISIMQNLYDVVISKYDTALTKVDTATERLHAAELQTKDDQHKKMILEETVDNLLKQVAALESRISALESDNQHEQMLRVEAEARAKVAEEKVEHLTLPGQKLPAGEEQIDVLAERLRGQP